MAPTFAATKYEYPVAPTTLRTLRVSDAPPKDEESPADYNAGGYLQIKLNDTFKDGRYVVLRKLGWGHFSTVWLVKDNESHRHSALKVVKSAGRYAETARDEIKLLSQVRDETPEHPGRDHVVSFLDSFQHTGPEGIHVCIVFEPLGENLLALIERHKKTGVPPALVKVIAKQLLLGLEYLHDECNLIHTDIKPENLMISIPDVEAHIRAELSVSPSPTSRKVGVPPKQIARSGVAIPRIATTRERHVQIFESQPLTSPSSMHSWSVSSSPNLRQGLQMSRMPSNRSIHSLLDRKSKLKLQTSSMQSDPSPPELSDGSSGESDSIVMPSSLGGLLGNDPMPVVAGVTSEESSAEKEVKETKSSAAISIAQQQQQQGGKPSSGPSLLSQTAPYHLYSANPALQQFDASTSYARRSPSPPTPYSPPPISIKIADLGNATPADRHYTEDIQTRQYRSPEIIMGRTDWNATADIWSAACVLFELLTAEYLFDPQSQGGVFGKDDDHMAQIIELLGNFDVDLKFGGRFSREIFDSTGALRYIRSLKPWPLKRVMMEKYSWNEQDSDALCAFLEPMLIIDHRKRKHARDMKDHAWLEVDPTNPDLVGW